MKLTITLQLKPTQKQVKNLLTMLEQANEAANVISQLAWENKTFGQFKLHRLVYHSILQSSSLAAQVVVRLIAK